MQLCRAFNCRILYDHHLPTVILIIMGIPSPTHSFTLGLNPYFSANPPYRSVSFFFFRIHYMDFPESLLLLKLTYVGFRARVKIALVSYRIVSPEFGTKLQTEVPLCCRLANFFTVQYRYCFIPGLKPSFSVNPSHRSLPFLIRD